MSCIQYSQKNDIEKRAEEIQFFLICIIQKFLNVIMIVGDENEHR